MADILLHAYHFSESWSSLNTILFVEKDPFSTNVSKHGVFGQRLSCLLFVWIHVFSYSFNCLELLLMMIWVKEMSMVMRELSVIVSALML